MGTRRPGSTRGGRAAQAHTGPLGMCCGGKRRKEKERTHGEAERRRRAEGGKGELDAHARGAKSAVGGGACVEGVAVGV